MSFCFKCCCKRETVDVDLLAIHDEINEQEKLIKYLSRFEDYDIADNSDGYITFGRRILAENLEKPRLVGWKFHITVPSAQIYEAATVIGAIVAREEIKEMKFYTPESLNAFQKTYCKEYLGTEEVSIMICQKIKSNFTGKEFTIYFYQHPNKDWARIVKEIEAKLIEKDIIPKLEIPPACIKIPGCRFFSYRCDQTDAPEELCYFDESLTDNEVYKERMKKIYISEEDALNMAHQHKDVNAYNPYNHPIPEKIKMIAENISDTRATIIEVCSVPL